MGVVMKGGTSGCREDYLAPVPSSGDSQPVLKTEGSATNSNVHFTQNSGNGEPGQPGEMNPPVPTSGENPIGADSLDRLNAYAPADIFRGAPNTGTSGGPA